MRKSKGILRAILWLALMAIIAWCASRWKVWFHNPEEAPYVASEVPTRLLLTFGDENGLQSRNVSWTCGEEVQASYVELVDNSQRNDSCQLSIVNCQLIKAQGEVFESRSGKAAYYVARLRDLKEGHTYRYRVCTGENKSEWHTFQLPSKDEHETAFIYMGDNQDSIGGIANQLLKEAFRQNPDAEFFVCGGDLTERPTDAYWGETFESLDSIGQVVPVLTVTGNHDYLKGVICTLERRFSLIHSYFLDSMIGENQVFTVRYKDVQIFCLDSNREFFYLWTQRQWFEEQLKKSEAKWKIVVLHHPLYSVKGTMNNLIQRWMFDDLIQEHSVSLVLQGHEHAYARRIAQPSTSNAQCPTAYIISHCSPKGYRINPPEGRFDRIEKDIRTYQKVCISNDTLFLTAFNAETGTLIDSLTLEARGKE